MTWITDHLAVGHAPMSYDDLDSIREQGISGIVNLCGEFSDLHELEEGAGFEVFYIPIPDETAPPMEEMEKGLEWLDEAIYLGKKVLIHCKHGVGRTGTFLTAYMLRRGFNLRKAEKLLRKARTRANPTNFSQWWLLRKFGKKEGQLKLYEPSAENRRSDDLSVYYKRYEQLLEKVDRLIEESGPASCGKKKETCSKNFNLSLIEALYLNNKVNVALTSEQRNAIIDQAVGITDTRKKEENTNTLQEGQLPVFHSISDTKCPLRKDGKCLLHTFRPVYCRLAGCSLDAKEVYAIYEELALLSEEVFYAVFGKQAAEYISLPDVSNRDTISGKFIQKYFQHLAAQKSDKKKNDDGKSE
ncbi:protein-tyrosine phosphatase family protein [Desulfogranum japonicum]|uniref:protein-tyrosine phosphatase family protein n=1 Tax=Desulfogranum japonicum TaxID=231447 RepID=UPI001E3481A0|nr:dual specificity protein phosphatase [Desulfogranum japonicum]